MGDGGPRDDAAHTGVVRGLGPGATFQVSGVWLHGRELQAHLVR